MRSFFVICELHGVFCLFSLSQIVTYFNDILSFVIKLFVHECVSIPLSMSNQKNLITNVDLEITDLSLFN